MIRYIFFASLLMLVSCSGIDKEKLIGDYYLTKIDYADSELDISFRLKETGNFIGVIPPKVIEVGFDENFIIAKQQFASENDIRFFIIPLKQKVNQSPDENKFGPMSIDEFKLKREELGVPDELVFFKKF